MKGFGRRTPTAPSGASLEKREHSCEAAGDGQLLASRRIDRPLESGDQAVELQDEVDRAFLLRLLAGLSQVLPELENVVPVSERVLELFLAGDPALQSRNAAGDQIFGQVAGAFDRDAVAMDPPIGCVFRRRREPALQAAAF